MTDPSDQLSVAMSLFDQGLQVFPAKYRGKAPLVEWRKHQKSKVSLKLVNTWFGGNQPRNYWVMTGDQSGYVVLDLDSKAGFDLFVRLMGKQALFSGAQVVSNQGKHFWFRIPEGYGPVQSWSHHDEKSGVSLDFRANDTGIIVPPSVHESGHLYEWKIPLEYAAEAPIELLDGTYRSQMPGDGSSGTKTGTGGVTRSLLSALLGKPPGGDGSGRNDWLARVAGHYAKTYHNQRDLYDAHCQQANQMMGTPLDEKEFNKTIESIWRGEHSRNEERALDANCGWLRGNGRRLFTQVATTLEDGTKNYSIEEYANFDITARGVMIADDDSRTYWLTLLRPSRHDPSNTDRVDVVVPGSTFGDQRKLTTWLASLGCTVLPPGRMWPREGSAGLRLQRYIESQKPPDVRVVRCLGWDSEAPQGGAFVTHDGVIRAEGAARAEESGIVADPSLRRGAAPHFYGFDNDWREARRVLTEVLSFHEPEVTSVFGAWWAACLLKPQIEENTSLFPFMAIQAPSESGKTNGFFSMMTQLNGNTRGEVQPTRAALRDMAAANRNGIVWVDDLDDPQYLMELLRAATSGGSLTKMGEDRESVKNTTIVSPIVISGESLGIENQKALVDRAISVSVPSPTGRRSRHDPDRPQWDDIIELRNQYPQGLSAVAGWMVSAALEVTPQVLQALKEGRTTGAGRSADKVAILRAGARLLDYLVGQDEATRDAAWAGGGEHAARVEQFLGRAAEGLHDQSHQENSLTMELLPWAIQEFGIHDAPKAGDHGQVDTPVFFKGYTEVDATNSNLLDPGTELWFNTMFLANAWRREHHGRISMRTQSAGALKEQANVLDAPSKRFKIQQSGGRLAYYRKLSGPIVQKIIERSQDK